MATWLRSNTAALAEQTYSMGAGLKRNAAFILGVWLITRLIIAVVFFSVAQRLPSTIAAPASLNGLDRLDFFDGGWYGQIVDHGYTYMPDGNQHSIAFFPLFPLVVLCLTFLHTSTSIAEVLVNNSAFLAMLFVVFASVRERCDAGAARWTIATLCCAPMSIFGSTGYSEGLFMLTASIGLQSLHKKQYGSATVMAMLASLVRLPGIALAPAFFAMMVSERRGPVAWLPSIAPVFGVATFCAYCRWRFGDWLAFVHAQSAWRPQLGYSAGAWAGLVGAGLASAPFLHVLTLVFIAALWLGRRRFPLIVQTTLTFGAVEAQRWAWNGSEYVMLFTVVATVAALRFRKELGAGSLTFLIAGDVIIALAGSPVSVDRFGYALTPGVFALALIWRRFPPLGFAAMAVMSIDLFEFALRFARGIFVA